MRSGLSCTAARWRSHATSASKPSTFRSPVRSCWLGASRKSTPKPRGCTGTLSSLCAEREVAREISPKLGAHAHFRRSEQVAIRGRTRLQRLDVNVGRLHPLQQTLEIGGRTQLDADQGLTGVELGDRK